MKDIETFDDLDDLDALYSKRKEDVTRMRAALLSCSSTNLSSLTAKTALKNITAMRIYHQIARIIRYLELMDKLEAKLYKSIEYTIDNSSESDISTLKMLLGIQESLQKQMIESHKLLQPYLDLESLNVIDLIPESGDNTDNPAAILMSVESRERIRNAANLVLDSLDQSDASEVSYKEIEDDAISK